MSDPKNFDFENYYYYFFEFFFQFQENREGERSERGG